MGINQENLFGIPLTDVSPIIKQSIKYGCMRVNSRSTYLMVVQTVAYSTTAHNQTIYRAHIRQLKEHSKPTKLTPQNNRK